jgi:hypothetical protein
MYFKCSLPGQELGSAPVLLVPFITAERLGESQNIVSAVCNARGMEGAGKSPQTSTYLFMVPPIQKGITKKNKWTVEYADIPVAST